MLTICGIDAGATVGVAIVDLDGKLVETKSFKHASITEIANYIVSKGRPIAIGSDVPKSEFARRVASALNCRIIKPEKPISRKKKAVFEGFRNEHERDAYISARYAWSKLHNLIKKINKRDKENIGQILEGIKRRQYPNIKSALTELRHHDIK